MQRDVWARNPDNYIKECIEVGQSKFIFDMGRTVSRALDVNTFFDLHMPHIEWDCLLVTDLGAMHLDNRHTRNSPKAVYPVWSFGQDLDKLEDWMMNPVGENLKLCSDKKIHVEERPVYGQEHIIVLQDLPIVSRTDGKRFFTLLRDMQDEYPDCKLHLHGLYSFRVMYGMNFMSTDFDPRNDAGLGYCALPTGKKLKHDNLASNDHWITLLDMKPVEMKVPRNRCMYNIKSHNWAANYFKEAVKIDTNGKKPVDADNPLRIAPENRSIFVSRKKLQEGDKFLCDLCSVQDSCKYYRQGAVCIVPGSDGVDLSRFFKTRDSETIITGLGNLMEVQTKRLGRALEYEEENNELSPETTKIINTLFDRGVKLAKLVNPSLNAPAARINISQSNTSISASTPQALMASIVDEFTRRGIPIDQITPELVNTIFEAPDDVKSRAIEVAATELATGQ